MSPFDPRTWLICAAAWWLMAEMVWPMVGHLMHDVNEVRFVLDPILGGLL